MDLSTRFQRLDDLLADHHWLWQPQPYKEPRPGWCDRLPTLSRQLLELDPERLQGLYIDAEARLRLLSTACPALAELQELTRLPELPQQRLKDLGPHFAVDIPGRKWDQINAFVAALPAHNGPVLDWCGGKGHLGRLLAAQWQQPVMTLERDDRLCQAGEHLALAASVPQRFVRADAFEVEPSLLHGCHPLALHACGGLHRRLLEQGLAAEVDSIDISPCCYHLHDEGPYRPYTCQARLRPSQDDLRLAVTETVTAKAREIRLRDREMAWKLGYQQLHQALTGCSHYVPTAPIDKRWLRDTFADFCVRLAARQGLALASAIDWKAYEQGGWQRQREVMALSLVRQAFRRPLELWLVLDLAKHLLRHGYRVRLGTFCTPELTPRNLLLSAWRERG